MEIKEQDLKYLNTTGQLRRIGKILQIRGDELYEKIGLIFKMSWVAVYRVLNGVDNPLSVIKIAKMVGVTHVTIKNVVREMRSAGIVEISQDLTDKRSKLIKLTPAGKEMYEKLSFVWTKYEKALAEIFKEVNPNLMFSLEKLEQLLSTIDFDKKVNGEDTSEPINIVDYQPNFKKSLYELFGKWLLSNSSTGLTDDDNFELHHPDQSYLLNGGFVFFAITKGEVVGCVVIKRIRSGEFELKRHYVSPALRNRGLASKLVQRCINRCQENGGQKITVKLAKQFEGISGLYKKAGFKTVESPENALQENYLSLTYNLLLGKPEESKHEPKTSV